MNLNIKKDKLRKFIILISFSLLTFQGAVAQKLGTSGDDYQLSKVIEVAGRQGIAVDKNFYYVSSSTALYKYAKSGTLVAKNEQPFGAIPNKVNHFGDIEVANGNIITGVEFFDAGTVRNIQIAVYDAKDLSYKYAIDFGKLEQPEVCGITVDHARQIAWMADWTQGNYVYKYNLATRKYIGKVHLQPSPQWQQGVYYVDGKLLITADDGDADLNEPDHIYICDVSDSTKTTSDVHLFRTMSEFRKCGEIEGITIDPSTNDLIVMSNRGAVIKMGMPVGFYRGYTHEIHEIYIFKLIK